MQITMHNKAAKTIYTNKYINLNNNNNGNRNAYATFVMMMIIAILTNLSRGKIPSCDFYAGQAGEINLLPAMGIGLLIYDYY